MDLERHIEDVKKQEQVVLEAVQQAALAQVVLERIRVDREAVPAAVSDAAVAYRTKESEMNEAVGNLRTLHTQALRSLGA